MCLVCFSEARRNDWRASGRLSNPRGALIWGGSLLPGLEQREEQRMRGSVPEGLLGTSWDVLPEDSYFSMKWEVRSSAEITDGGGGLGRRV